MYSTTLLMTGRHDGHMWIQSILWVGRSKPNIVVANKVKVQIRSGQLLHGNSLYCIFNHS